MPTTPTDLHRSRRAPGHTLGGLALAALCAGALAACGGPGPSPSAVPASMGSTRPLATAAVFPTPAATTVPDLTPVPGSTDGPGVTEEPIPPVVDGGGTTVTDWGTILDEVPEGFPVFPDARPAEAADGPVSGAWIVDGPGVDEVSGWYRDRLEALGFTTADLSSPLEDGSRVLDTVSDLPECRIQTTFRPAGGSTMIIVLYGAGCAGGEG